MKTKPVVERVTVITAINDSYALPLAVMLKSLSTSATGNYIVDVRILTLGLSTDTRKRLDKCLAGSNVEFQEVRVDPAPLEGLKVDGHVSLETYFRLLSPTYINDVSKVIYLDADLIIRHSILELYHEPMNGAYLLAAPMISRRSGFFEGERGVPSFRALSIPGRTRTFNAGVMVLDLDSWRENNVAASVLQYLREYRSLVLWWDQDGLNAVLHANWRPLEAKWNVMASHFVDFQRWEDSLLDEATFEAVLRNPGIIHFSSLPKPWSGGYSGPFAADWHQTYALVERHFQFKKDLEDPHGLHP